MVKRILCTFLLSLLSLGISNQIYSHDKREGERLVLLPTNRGNRPRMPQYGEDVFPVAYFVSESLLIIEVNEDLGFADILISDSSASKSIQYRMNTPESMCFDVKGFREMYILLVTEHGSFDGLIYVDD